MPYNCASDDGNLAAVILTNLETGDTLAACPVCMPTLLLGLVEASTGQTYAPTGDSVPDLETDDETDDDEHVPAVPETPPGADSPPEVAPGGPDDDQADDDGSDSLTRQEEAYGAEQAAKEWQDQHDQLSEDQANYGAELAAQLGRQVSG